MTGTCEIHRWQEAAWTALTDSPAPGERAATHRLASRGGLWFSTSALHRGDRYVPVVLDLAEEFRALVGALESAGVDFAVCGGLAVAIHAQPRATVAIDLLLRSGSMEAAKGVARSLGYSNEAGPMMIRPGAIEIHRLSKPDPDSGDLLSIDFLLVTEALEPVWAGRERVEWQYGDLPVVSRTGLIQMKRLRASGQDLDDIRALEENGDGET